MKTVLQADSVLGTPRDFDGTKIVPVVSVVLGFGSGTGASTSRGYRPRHGPRRGAMSVRRASWSLQKRVKCKSWRPKGGFSEALKTIVPAVVESLRGKKEPREPAK